MSTEPLHINDKKKSTESHVSIPQSPKHAKTNKTQQQTLQLVTNLS